MKDIVATDENTTPDNMAALESLIHIVEDTEKRYGDESLSRADMIRVIDDAIASAEAVAAACPTAWIKRDVRSLVLAGEALKKEYGWRPPRVPPAFLPDSQLSFVFSA